MVVQLRNARWGDSSDTVLKTVPKRVKKTSLYKAKQTS